MKEGLSLEKGKVNGRGKVKCGGKRRIGKGGKLRVGKGEGLDGGKKVKGEGKGKKGEGVSMDKCVEGVLPISLPGVKKLLHNINTHRYCAAKTIKLFGFPIF